MLALIFFVIVSAGLAITSYFEVRPTQPTTYGLPTLGGVPFDIAPSPPLFFDTCPRLSPIQIMYSSLAYTSHDIDLASNPSDFVPIALEHLGQQENFPDPNHGTTPMHPESVAHFRDVSPEFAVDNIGMFLIVAQFGVILGLFFIRIPPRVIVKYVDQTAKDLYISMLMEKLSRLAQKRKETKTKTDKSIADLDDQIVDLNGQIVHLNRRLKSTKFVMTDSSLRACRFEKELATSREELNTTRSDLGQRDEVIARMIKEKRKSDAQLDSLRGDVSRMTATAESQDNTLAAVERKFEERLERIKAEHQTRLADMEKNHLESLEDEKRRHQSIIQEKAKEIVGLESTAASARATIAKLELRVEELELMVLPPASPPTPPTTPSAPTNEQRDTPSTSNNVLQLDLACDTTPSSVAAQVDPVPEPTADPCPPVAADNVEPPSDTTTTTTTTTTPTTASSSSRPESAGPFSDAPRGLSASMWAPGPEDSATIPSRRSQGPDNARQQGGGHRSRKQKNPAYSGTRYYTPKRYGPQTAYDTHDHRG